MNTQSTTTRTPTLAPASRLRGLEPYTPPDQSPRTQLRLDANEGPTPDIALLEVIRSITPEQIRRYPNAAPLERDIARQLGVDPERVVVTNGADDAIDRACRALLEPGRSLLTHTPGFEMIERSARLAGADVQRIAWESGTFPTDAFIDAIRPGVGLVALVSPNNPTGGAIPSEDILRVTRAAARIGAAALIDLAYTEFADTDPTPDLLAEPNAVITRTFSKAKGLAGLRIGYAVAPQPISTWLRTTGGPYPVSAVSLAAAAAALTPTPESQAFIARICSERDRLTELLTKLDADPIPSQANFVTAKFNNTGFVRRALASLGISVRAISSFADAAVRLRITLPGNESDFDRLTGSIESAIRPQAFLFDLDGVLADVSTSYRRAIIETARSFGATVTGEQIARAKRAGDANNDWVLTRRLLADAGVEVPLDEITERFQCLYLGGDDTPGLRESESLIPAPDLLRRLASRLPLAIVTGRPRAEAEWFLDRAGIRNLFQTIIAMEDAEPKPSPEPVRRALAELKIDRAWMIGDTPDDAAAAIGARVVPIGIPAPSDDPAPSTESLTDAGAAIVLTDLAQLEELLA